MWARSSHEYLGSLPEGPGEESGVLGGDWGGGELWQGYLVMNAVNKAQPLTYLQLGGGDQTVMVHR